MIAQAPSLSATGGCDGLRELSLSPAG